MHLFLVLLLPLLAACLPARVGHHFGAAAAAWTAAAGTLAALVAALPPLLSVFAGTPVQVGLAWLPQIGLDLFLRLDGLAALFVLLVLGIGLLVILYASQYLAEGERIGRFFGLLLLFMGAMLGVVLSDNLLLLLVFWEMTSLSSFLLIGFWHHRAEARRGAYMALTVTGGGGLALLAGFLLLGHMAGTFRISSILQAGELIRGHDLYLPMLVLILTGAFAKSAQFPFHFWLPHAMEAPTPVSAYLHSATMVKAGVFLLARLYPVLSGTDPWFFLVGGTGLVTLLFGAYMALFQHDLKGLLAYSTISHLGLIVLLFGLDTPMAAVAAVFHIINHATFKASLFMTAGIIDHETGTRDMRRINGLYRFMPRTALLAMVATAAMAGVPLLNGFLSKEMFFAETVHLSGLTPVALLLPAAATLASVFSVAYSARFIHDVFFNGEPVNLPRYPPHDAPRLMRLPLVILVAHCLIVGIFPGLTVAPFLRLAAASVLGSPLPAFDLAVWHGFNLPLAMSAAALILGISLYAVRHQLFALHAQLFPGVDAHSLFSQLVEGAFGAARRWTAATANGSLQRSLALLFCAAAAAMAVPLVRGLWPPLGPPPVPLDGLTLFGGLAMITGAVLTVRWHRRRFLALIPLSVVGLMCALAFVRFSAPDLALTQLAIEVVTIILLLLALFFLPQRTPVESTPRRRLRDLLLSLAMGSGAGLLTWTVLTRPPAATIADFFLANSLPGGGGANVVNVILVDFRGFDTLGEISVLAIAALAIHALLDGLWLPPCGRPCGCGHEPVGEQFPLNLAQMTRFLLPLALLVSIYLFLRGHNAPGGGFIAALVTAAALILQYLASGIAWTREQWAVRYHRLIAWGLCLALLTGLGSWLFGRPFLTSAFGHFALPLAGEFELATAMLFDLGVYLAVVGALMLVLTSLGDLNRRCLQAGGGS